MGQRLAAEVGTRGVLENSSNQTSGLVGVGVGAGVRLVGRDVVPGEVQLAGPMAGEVAGIESCTLANGSEAISSRRSWSAACSRATCRLPACPPTRRASGTPSRSSCSPMSSLACARPHRPRPRRRHAFALSAVSISVALDEAHFLRLSPKPMSASSPSSPWSSTVRRCTPRTRLTAVRRVAWVLFCGQGSSGGSS